ncbi:mRNA cleavage and polyadenylation factor CLP1 [Leucoagaricus sp. SymC.cos]|nr:mRNA cleavage and polyadenylation factor CLP1 [Leucoagaricus sp. SymC.cos]
MSTQPLSPDTQEWVLKPESEYRFELDPDTSLAIKLVRGKAEIFGAELVPGKYYLFGVECKAAVFTWRGCTIEISQPSTEYVSEDTPMKAYGNLHIALEKMRVRSLFSLTGSTLTPGEPQSNAIPSEPPRVLVIGPVNSGKTTKCKILTNYCVRVGQNWSPVLVNIDPNDGGWAPPGALSAAAVRDPIHTYSAATSLGSAATTAPMSLASNTLFPLVYWYGHADPKRNPQLMERLIRNLGENMDERFDKNPESKASGCIVDTPALFSSGPAASTEVRQKLIKACVDAFKINTILVVGQEKLSAEMKKIYSKQLTVIKIPKSGGVVDLDTAFRERLHSHQIHTYMYGTNIKPPPGVPSSSISIAGEPNSDLILSPASTTVTVGELSVFRIGTEAMAPASALPIGAKRVVSEMQPISVDAGLPGSGLLNRVLAIMAPFNPDENERYDEEILDLTVRGIVVVTALDLKTKRMTILKPNRDSISGKTAIVGTFEWQDE